MSVLNESGEWWFSSLFFHQRLGGSNLVACLGRSISLCLLVRVTRCHQSSILSWRRDLSFTQLVFLSDVVFEKPDAPVCPESRNSCRSLFVVQFQHLHNQGPWQTPLFSSHLSRGKGREILQIKVKLRWFRLQGEMRFFPWRMSQCRHKQKVESVV